MGTGSPLALATVANVAADDGQDSGDAVSVDYSYNADNLLAGFTTGGFGGITPPTFSLADVNVDGLGRLRCATETISYPGQSNRSRSLGYQYDMLSQLTDANITNIAGSDWTAAYGYKKDGNIERKTVNGGDTCYRYDTTPDGDVFHSDIMTRAGDDQLFWDENGRLVETPTIDFDHNWDGKLRAAAIGSNSISLKYDPMGNRVCKLSTLKGDRKYVVDVSGELPTILCQIDPTDSSLKNSYIYVYPPRRANGQTCLGVAQRSRILCQYQGQTDPNWHFYIHDRLGSVRLVISDAADVNNSYTYAAFGDPFASEWRTRYLLTSITNISTVIGSMPEFQHRWGKN